MEHDWSPEEEVQLFLAMDGLAPVGIHKHFYMVCIAERLCKPPEHVWKHLNTIYKLTDLEKLEHLPFPNDETDFDLPDSDFAECKLKKRSENEERVEVINSIESTTKAADKLSSVKTPTPQQIKDLEKKLVGKVPDVSKRPAKRTRGSISIESNSPSTTPPPVQTNKRRRI